MLVLAEQNRTFGYAVAASIALHALFLALNPPARREALPPPEPPLVAHLVELAPPPAPAPVVKEPPQPARPKPSAKPKPAPAPTPQPTPPIAAPAPTPAPPPAPLPEQAVEEGVSQADAELAPAPVAPVAAVAPPAAVQPPDPAAALALFRQQLVDLAGRYKRYPRQAADNGWTGDVVVRIDVAASGAVASIKVRTSSGFDVLDEQALDMFRRAVPEVAVPPALRGKNFSIDVRAIYNLNDRPG
jgi:protein TonB